LPSSRAQQDDEEAVMKTAWSALLVGLVLTGCNGEPTEQEIEDAKVRTEAGLASADRLRTVLELIGLLPTYDCGEPRRSFVGEAAEGIRTKLACATATVEAEGETGDLIRVAFPEEGCKAFGHQLTGEVLYRFSGGEDRMDLAADLGSLQIDGEPIEAEGGYGTCSDETRYWASIEGRVPRTSDTSFSLDGRVAARDGIPVIGGTELVVDGPGAVTRPEGTDKVTFDGLHYEIGEYLPKDGRLLIETASGHSIEATFHSTLWRLGKAQIVVDGSDPVTVPIVH
jgi:hypothetical protein